MIYPYLDFKVCGIMERSQVNTDLTETLRRFLKSASIDISSLVELPTVELRFSIPWIYFKSLFDRGAFYWGRIFRLEYGYLDSMGRKKWWHLPMYMFATVPRIRFGDVCDIGYSMVLQEYSSLFKQEVSSEVRQGTLEQFFEELKQIWGDVIGDIKGDIYEKEKNKTFDYGGLLQGNSLHMVLRRELPEFLGINPCLVKLRYNKDNKLDIIIGQDEDVPLYELVYRQTKELTSKQTIEESEHEIIHVPMLEFAFDPLPMFYFDDMLTDTVFTKVSADTKTVVEETAEKPVQNSQVGNRGKMAIRPGTESNELLKNKAQAEFYNKIKNLTFEAEVVFLPQIMPQDIVKVKGITDGIDGLYIVMGIKHELLENWKTRLELLRHDSEIEGFLNRFNL